MPTVRGVRNEEKTKKLNHVRRRPVYIQTKTRLDISCIDTRGESPPTPKRVFASAPRCGGGSGSVSPAQHQQRTSRVEHFQLQPWATVRPGWHPQGLTPAPARGMRVFNERATSSMLDKTHKLILRLCLTVTTPWDPKLLSLNLQLNQSPRA